MNDSDVIDMLGGTAAVARRTKTREASVSGWRKYGIPAGRIIELAAEIEGAGICNRWDLRPDDWHRIWPELIGTKGAPPVPQLQSQAA